MQTEAQKSHCPWGGDRTLTLEFPCRSLPACNTCTWVLVTPSVTYCTSSIPPGLQHPAVTEQSRYYVINSNRDSASEGELLFVMSPPMIVKRHWCHACCWVVQDLNEEIFIYKAAAAVILVRLLNCVCIQLSWRWSTWINRVSACTESPQTHGFMIRGTPQHLVFLFCFHRGVSPQPGCSSRCPMGVPEGPDPRVRKSNLA